MIDLSTILDLNIYASPCVPVNSLTLAPFFQTLPAAPPPLHSCKPDCTDLHSHSHSPESSPHSNDITSITILLPLLPEAKGGAFDQLVRELLWDGYLPPLDIGTGKVSESVEEGTPEFEILRSKGFIRTRDGKAWILQGVRDLYEVTPVPERVEQRKSSNGEEEIHPKLVLIGKGLGPLVAERFLSALLTKLG